MPRAARVVCGVQAVALVAVAVALVVLSLATSLTLSVAFLLVDVGLALAGAALLGPLAGRRRLRTPVLLLELIAVLVSTQLYGNHRLLAALAVGVPALAAIVLLLQSARGERR